MKSVTMPIPVDAEIDAMVRASAEATGLKLADVMRQGLRHGVPAFTEKLREATVSRPPVSLGYVDEYPAATVEAGKYKAALKEKLGKKYGRSHR